MSAKRRGLGRGLDALLGGEPESKAGAAAAVTGVTMLPVTRLKPNRYQPRSHFDESGIEELAASIRAQGVIQPLVVTPGEQGAGETAEDVGDYVIIAGERRWRAAQRAGLELVPVVVREITERRQILELALVENLQRADLNPIEEAEAYRTLGETFELSQEQIADRVGKGRPTVTNALRLLRLPAPIQDFLRDGRLTAGQARPLIAVANPDRQLRLAEEAVEKGLTARDLEALAAAADEKSGPGTARTRPELDVHTRAAMEKLTRSLQTRVDIVRRRRGGEIRIHFHSEDELINIYDRLMKGYE